MKAIVSLILCLPLLLVACDSSDSETTTGGTTAGTTAGTTTGATEAGTTAGTTTGATEAGTTAGTTGATEAGTTAGTTGATEAGTTAGTTGATEAGTTAGTTGATEAGTTAGTTGGTTTPQTRTEMILAMTGNPDNNTPYMQNCSSCHGADAMGGTGSNLLQEIVNETNFVNTILMGRGREMPPYDYLADQEIADIVAYVKSLAN